MTTEALHPPTVHVSAAWARLKFAGNLVVANSAEKSRKDSPFKDVARVCLLFGAAAGALRDHLMGKLPIESVQASLAQAIRSDDTEFFRWPLAQARPAIYAVKDQFAAPLFADCHLKVESLEGVVIYRDRRGHDGADTDPLPVAIFIHRQK